MRNSARCSLLSVVLLLFFTISAAGQCLTGDLSGDCTVNWEDLRLFASQWLDIGGCTGPDCADLDNDDSVDITDFTMLASNWFESNVPPIVINEIHSNPDLKVEQVEFVELYNAGDEAVDLSGWYFSRGINYTFPPGTSLGPNSYLVVVEDSTLFDPNTLSSADFTAKWPGVTPTGVFAGKLSNGGETIELNNADGQEIDTVDYQLGFPWPTVGDAVPDVPPGGTGRSMQLVNPSFDNDLGGSWRSAYPTPKAKNTAVFANNIPPHIRQVEHSPQQPTSGQTVTITCKVTDPNGVASVTLAYQVVNPGSYIPVTLPNLSISQPTIPNPDYENPANWSNLSMNDNGTSGDQIAGDDIYTVQISSSLQTHRRLIRYRITVQDTLSNSVTVPYADDPQLNFAYFVYDGVPAWSGAINPSGSPPDNQVVTYGTDVMRSLPVYHLISREGDVEKCQWNEGYGKDQRWDTGLYHFGGTLVYDGKAYDNIHYRIRGIWATFVWGKNKWKFNFNRGHYFEGRDDYGRRYETKWNKMNFGTGACPWWHYPHPSDPFDADGTAGMFLNENMSLRFYRMAGVPSSNTNYLHFRVIDKAAEADPLNQYEGDFWGLYLAVEEPDGAFINEHGLLDGNIYKMEDTIGQVNQGPTQVTDYSDVYWFISSSTGYNKTSPYQPLSWWQSNVNLEGYYSFKSVGIAVNNSDPRPERNCLYYHDPVTNQWTIIPWDLDLTYEWGIHYADMEHLRYCLAYQECSIANKNRARELLDLLFSTDQAWQMVDEVASIISTPYGGKTFVEAERAIWENHPRMQPEYKGLWYENNEFLTTNDWAGLIEYYKRFLSPAGFYEANLPAEDYGVHSLISNAYDMNIPGKPAVAAIGDANFPINNLVFETTPFSDPQGAGTFAAMKWRIAEVESGAGGDVDLIPDGAQWRYFKGTAAPPSQWRQPSFSDSDWLLGNTAIGCGEPFIVTNLSDMKGGYTTVYLRKAFDVIDPNAIDELELQVRYDDGFNAWINGTFVAQHNVSSSELPYTATAVSSIENSDFVSFMIPETNSCLASGTNLLAVQLLNYKKTDTDAFFDSRLVARYVGSYTNPVDPGKYEIEAVWESPEITDPCLTTITIPAGDVRQGRTYRVRCRMKDNTNRWSHWSDPCQFVAGEPLSAGGFLINLSKYEYPLGAPKPSVILSPIPSNKTGLWLQICLNGSAGTPGPAGPVPAARYTLK